MSAGFPAWYYLNLFAKEVEILFDGNIPYHVGSSLSNKRDWYDVDVVVIIDDDEWDKMGFGPHESPNHKQVVLCAALSELGRKMTGLPIDFKIQARTYANEYYPNPRSALGISF